MEHKWKKPNNGRVKCNIDASFSSNLNRVGIGICICDEYGVYVMAKYDQYSPI
ncbi:cytochrome P450, partial [Trifolium medium]|nr:cytochrome P450 [Trifolium medium]